jgi:hypothetical protein
LATKILKNVPTHAQVNGHEENIFAPVVGQKFDANRTEKEIEIHLVSIDLY